MPLPPLTPTGGGSGGPYTRTEHMYAWQVSDTYLLPLEHDEEHATPRDGGTHRDLHSRGRTCLSSRDGLKSIALMDDAQGFNDLSPEEQKLVIDGEAYITRGLPGKLKNKFAEAVAQRKDFDTEDDYTQHLTRNEYLSRSHVRQRAQRNDQKRMDRAASLEQKIAKDAKEAERTAKFQQRYGYAPGSFPNLPDFRLPKNSTLEDRLDKLDKQCLRKLEADAKGVRMKKERRPRTEPLNRLGLGRLGSRSVTRGSGVLSKTGKNLMLMNAIASPRSNLNAKIQTKTNDPREGSKVDLSKQSTSINTVLRAMSPRKTSYEGNSKIPEPPGRSAEGGPGHPGGEPALHRTLLFHELKNIAKEVTDVTGDPEEWMQVLNSTSRPRDHAQESLLPLLNDEPLHDFVRKHEEYNNASKDWRTIMKDRIRNRIAAAAASQQSQNVLRDVEASMTVKYKPWLENNSAVKNRLTKSRLAVAERYIYGYLDEREKDYSLETPGSSLKGLSLAKNFATIKKLDTILGKEDADTDRLESTVWRQHSFRWREMLEFTEHGKPPSPMDLWTMLQMLQVQFDSISPNGTGNSVSIKLEQLERESRRIEGLFASTLLPNGVPKSERDAQHFESKTISEVKRLREKYLRGGLKGPTIDHEEDIASVDLFASETSSGSASRSLSPSRRSPSPTRRSPSPTRSLAFQEELIDERKEETDEKQKEEDSRPTTPMTARSNSEPGTFRRLQSRNAMSKKFLSNVAKVRKQETPYATRSWEVICRDEAKVWMNHADLNTYQLAATIIWLAQPTQKLTIRKLCLADNGLDDIAFSLLLDGLDGTMNIQHLDISQNRLKSASALLLGQHFAKGHCEALLELNVSRNRLGDRGSEALLEALSHTHNNLLSLAMRDMEVSDKASEKFADCIISNSRIRSLDFSHNLMAERGGMLLGDSLPTNGRLVRLDLSNCGLGDAGAKAVVNGLASSVSLRWFNLSANRLGIQTAQALCTTLEAHPMPQLVILLHDNPLGQEAAGMLIRVNASDVVKHIDMSRAMLNEAAIADPKKLLQQDGNAEPVTFDPRCPSRVYRLELSNSNHREVAKQLLAARKRDGAGTWRKATFNSAPLSLSDAMCQGWMQSPANAPKPKEAEKKKKKKSKKTDDSTKLTMEMPASGTLMVDFQTHNVVYAKSVSEGLKQEHFESMLAEISSKAASEEWILTFLRALPPTFFFSTAQVQVLLDIFEWSLERISAAVCLFSRLVDPQNFDKSIGKLLKPDEQRQVDEQIGIVKMLDPERPTGHYKVDLQLSIDRLVAQRLLDIWTDEVQSGQCLLAQKKTCWRNVRLGGAAVDASSKDPTQWELPSEGELTLDFVSFKVYAAHQRGKDQEGSSVPPSPAPSPSRGPALSRAPESPSGTSADAAPPLSRALSIKRASQKSMVEDVEDTSRVMTNAMAQVLAEELVKENIVSSKDLAVLVSLTRVDTTREKEIKESEMNLFEAAEQVEKSAAALEEIKSMAGSKSALKQAAAGYAQAKAVLASLREPLLIRKMSAAALDRLNMPYADILPGVDPTLIPEVLEEPQSDETTVREVSAKSKSKSKKKSKKSSSKDTSLAADKDAKRLLKVNEKNRAKALQGIAAVLSGWNVTITQMDLLVALFDDCDSKVEVVVSSYDRLVEKADLGKLLRSLPQDAQVTVCRRLGWNNVCTMSMVSLHFVLDLDLEDDKFLLRQLVATHADEANLRGLGYTQTDYVQDSQGCGLIQNLAYDGHPIAGPVRNKDLLDHLVKLKSQEPGEAEGDEAPAQENAQTAANEAGDGEAATDEDATVQKPLPWGHYGAGYVEFDFTSPGLINK